MRMNMNPEPGQVAKVAKALLVTDERATDLIRDFREFCSQYEVDFHGDEGSSADAVCISRASGVGEEVWINDLLPAETTEKPPLTPTIIAGIRLPLVDLLDGVDRRYTPKYVVTLYGPILEKGVCGGIKCLADLTNMSLMQAKYFVDNLPQTFATKVAWHRTRTVAMDEAELRQVLPKLSEWFSLDVGLVYASSCDGLELPPDSDEAGQPVG